MKRASIALLALPLLVTLSACQKDPNKKDIDYLNEKDAAIYSLFDSRSLFKDMKYGGDAKTVADIDTDHKYLFVFVDVPSHLDELTKDVMEDLHRLVEGDSLAWITFWNAPDYYFLKDTAFDWHPRRYENKPALMYSSFSQRVHDYPNDAHLTTYENHGSADATDPAYYKRTTINATCVSVKTIESLE